MISSLLTVGLLAGVIFLGIRLQPVYQFIEEIPPVLEQAAKLDVDTINDTLEQIKISIGSVDWQQVSDTLGAVGCGSHQ